MIDIKVGDKLVRDSHSEEYIVKVLCIGNNTFYCRDFYNREYTIDFDSGWKQYKEEVIKDLEGVFKFYAIHKREGRLQVVSYLGDEVFFKRTKSAIDSGSGETITEKEAIERGLNV